MGLSSKQVSSDGSPGWSQSLLPKGSTMKKRNPQNQHQNQQPEPLKCPRCDSSNTKFCYYNNYNKSQPRYYCKACKRHWTKGGTLRNVPIGGGRKNKRHKAASNSIKATSTIASTSKTSTSSIKSSFKAIQRQQNNQELQLPLPHGVVEGFSPPSKQVYHVRRTSQHVQYYPQSAGSYLPTLPSDDKTQWLEFPFSSSSSFETTPSSISTSFQSPSLYNYNGEAMKDPTITSGSNVSQTWQVPVSTSCGMDMDMDMDMANYWNLDDIDALVSTDLDIHWDDSEIKLP